MEATQPTVKKSNALNQLSFGAKTAKRVAWASWHFTISGPREIEVTNANYGPFAEDHTYHVQIDEAGVPISCTCSGFQHHYEPRGEAGKHMVAVAAVGGPTVLEAALRVSAPTSPDSSPPPLSEDTSALLTDGGTVAAVEEDTEACPNGDSRCAGPDGDGLPCFPCWMARGGE